MHEASLYSELEEQYVQCRLCPHSCRIAPGEQGRCGVRKNQGGKLYSLVYGRIIGGAVDPIEKKPLFHVMPGSYSFSIATVGCNLSCDFCQNFDISQAERHASIPGTPMEPSDVVDAAEANGCTSIAYTYTEPTIQLEFARDTAKEAQKRGIRNVFVTNGYITPEGIDMIAPYLDAANIDLKGFSESFYAEKCHGHFKPVQEAIRRYHRAGVFCEITTLIVPDHNDSDEMLRAIARFIVSLSPDVPWHISRFMPQYKMQDHTPTPVERLQRAVQIGTQEGIRYIYMGNVPGNEHESTSCPFCGTRVIERRGFEVVSMQLQDSCCGSCGETLNLLR